MSVLELKIQKTLCSLMNPDFIDLDRLVTTGALSNEEVKLIRSEADVAGKNQKLINFILAKGNVQKLAEALATSKQNHLVVYLASNGVYSPDFGECWPLDEKQSAILEGNDDSLVDMIDAKALVDLLFKLDAIHAEQRDCVLGEKTDQDQNAAFLKMLRSSSQSCYNATITCLQQTNQSRLATILTLGGVIVPVQVSTKGCSPEIDIEIAKKITCYLDGQSMPESEALVKFVGYGLMNARVCKGLMLYFHPKNVSDIVELNRKMESDQLKLEVVSMFQQLTETSQDFNLELKWKNQDYQRALLIFSKLPASEGQSTTMMEDLDDPIRRKILIKVYLMNFLKEETETCHQEKDIFSSLSSVSQPWNKLVSDQDFKKQLDSNMCKYFERILRRAAVLRNNHYFLIYHMKARGLIDKLHHADCLTDDDTRYIKCQTYEHDKIDETLNVMRDLSIEKYAVYVESLRQTDQHLAADISETGGVTLKTKSICEDSEKYKQLELKIVERLNQLRDKKVARSAEVEAWVEKVGKHGIELLSADYDYGIVCWFWCHSQEALNKFSEWNDNDHIEDVLAELFEAASNWGPQVQKHTAPFKPEYLIIDGWQLQRDVVVLPMQLHHVAELSINADRGPVRGVTNIPDHFIAIHPQSVVIYQDAEPFNLLNEISSADFSLLSDVAACPVSLSLYAADEQKCCIWKISPSTGEVSLWLKSITWPFSCSVCKTGEVLVLKSSSLEIYQPDGTLLQSIPLSLKNPRHATETRSGNLSILSENGLIEMTRRGVVVRQHKHFTLKNASYLALDQAERAYVVDGERIIQFDPQLSYDQVILGEDKCQDKVHGQLTRMNYVDKKKQFLMVHNNGLNVDVFNLRPKE